MSTRDPSPASEARQHEVRQIAWAAASLGFGSAPHLWAVAPWITLFALALVSWRITAALRHWRLPPLWLRLPLTLFGLAGVLFTYQAISGIEAGSALLLVMAALKLLETRSPRDRIVVVFIAYFLLFAVVLREQAIWSFGWLLCGSLGITTALIQTMRREPLRGATAAGWQAATLLLQALPLAALLFLLFPRIPGPFWAMPEVGRSSRSGLAEEIRPGDISELTLSDAVAFRVRFTDRVPPAGFLYWRGPVLEQFDGRTWSAAWHPARLQGTPPEMHSTGPVYDYQLVLEPHEARWLLALETPLEWSLPRAGLGPGLQLLSPDAVHERLSYHARSATGATSAGAASAATLSLNRRLPERINPRTLALGRALRSAARSEALFLQRSLDWFAARPFVYTLTPPVLGRHAVDEFLFGTRAGFCEHYASALAVLLRAGGVPARVVVGYQGAEHSLFGDYWIVRQANAHAWVETWIEGAWRRVDPTATVAPGRIELGYAETLAGTPRISTRLWRSNPWVHRLTLSWDAVNAAWDRWVLAYGPQMQQELLLRLGFEVPRTLQLAGLAAGASLICLLVMALALRQRRAPADPAARIYEDLCRRLGRVLRPRQPTETPEHYAREIGRLRPDLQLDLRHITDLYLRVRYGGANHARCHRQLVQAIRQFRARIRRRTSGIS